MCTKADSLRDLISEWVVNDYFTPSIKAEVVLDTLLTRYIPQILKDQLGIDAEFLTKELPMEDREEKEQSHKQDDRGARIDYLLVGEYVYLVELKTTGGSINSKQADRYLSNCCGPDCVPSTFKEVFGDKLLRIAHKTRKGIPKGPEWLREAFQEVVGGEGGYADRARGFLRTRGLDSTHKYLYSIGQILDRCPDLDALWHKELRLIYLTPSGENVLPNMPKERDMEKWAALYIGPNGPDSSVSLQKAVGRLSPGDELAALLQSIMTAIYPAKAELTIHRGSHQIGGCCTEIACGGERVLIDLGANLPDSDAPISDGALLKKVFDGRPAAGLLFTHPHGDHYGLYKEVPGGVPMYIGPVAKEILRALVTRLDYISREKGLPVVERMRTYKAGEELMAFENIQVLPFYVDHSAPDAHMFYIQAAGKKILFSGDFRDHGVLGERDRLWRTLEKFVPRGIDLLVTEGTMLSRGGETASNRVRTERELGQRAEELFRRHRYNFVLVSSTNLDSIMEFYQHTPKGMHFVCDAYQAEVMLTAMSGMERRGEYPQYQRSESHPLIRVLNGERQWGRLRRLGAALKKPVLVGPVSGKALERDGFVMLARKNADPSRKTVFDEKLEEFYPRDGQLIYSMWDGYLEPEHADKALIDFIGGRPIERLHTSGHAYIETIARLIRTVQPKTIVPMHTERADEFSKIPEFAPWADRVKVLADGEPLDLDEL